MYDDFDDYLDVELDEERDPGPDAEMADYVLEVLGRIASCDNVMWRSGAWSVELTLDDGNETELDLNEYELRYLAGEEPLVAAQCDGYSGPSDVAERESERRQMGFGDF